MAAIEVTMPDEVLRGIQDKLGFDYKLTDMTKDALTLYNWAVEQRAQGRLVLSANRDGKNVIPVSMPSLDIIRPRN